MSRLTEEERLARAIKSRETQLTEMSIQLSQHKANVKRIRERRAEALKLYLAGKV